MADEKLFMTTAWTHLAMLNFEIDPQILQTHVPSGTELDTFDGRTFVSMVGFRFQQTRVFGVPLPFHRNFEEVNLRYYVRRRGLDGWRRGVVFLKEIVALPAVAWAARVFYDEHFAVLPVQYTIDTTGDAPHEMRGVSYQWKYRGEWQRLAVQTEGSPQPTVAGSEEQFIAEHYWGYTRRRDGTTTEFRVDHPPWRVWRVTDVRFECDVAGLYGSEFAEPLAAAPSSAFLAEGSEVALYRGRRLPSEESFPAGAKLAAEGVIH